MKKDKQNAIDTFVTDIWEESYPWETVSSGAEIYQAQAFITKEVVLKISK